MRSDRLSAEKHHWSFPLWYFCLVFSNHTYLCWSSILFLELTLILIERVCVDRSSCGEWVEQLPITSIQSFVLPTSNACCSQVPRIMTPPSLMWTWFMLQTVDWASTECEQSSKVRCSFTLLQWLFPSKRKFFYSVTVCSNEGMLTHESRLEKPSHLINLKRARARQTKVFNLLTPAEKFLWFLFFPE